MHYLGASQPPLSPSLPQVRPVGAEPEAGILAKWFLEGVLWVKRVKELNEQDKETRKSRSDFWGTQADTYCKQDLKKI